MADKIEYKGQEFTCREVFEEETGLTQLVAPMELGELLIDEHGNAFDETAESIDSNIFFYATEEEMLLSDEELIKLAYNIL